MFTIKVLDPETEQALKTIKADKNSLLKEIISICEHGVDTVDVSITSAKGEIFASDLCEYLPVTNSVVQIYNDREWEEPAILGVVALPTHMVFLPKSEDDMKEGFRFLIESNGWLITDNDILCNVCPLTALPDMPMDDPLKQMEYLKKNCVEVSLFRTELLAGDVLATGNGNNAPAASCFDITTDVDGDIVILNRYGVRVGIPAIDNPTMEAMCVHEISNENGYIIGYCLNVGNDEICQFGDEDRYIEDFFVDSDYYTMGEFLEEYLFESERMYEKYFDCFTNETFLCCFCNNIPEWLTVFSQDRKAFWIMFRTLADACLETEFTQEEVQKVFDKNAGFVKKTVKEACRGFKKRMGADRL